MSSQANTPNLPASTPGGGLARNSRAAALPAALSRSWLLTSAATDTAFGPALASEADSVILDLEDGVPQPGKSAARSRVTAALHAGAAAWVRINGTDTDDWAADLQAISGAPGLRGVMLAMTNHPEQVTETARRLPPGTPVIALIETALGVDNASSIARADGVFRLAFGIGDFRRDTGASGDPMALAYARGRLVVASAVGRLPGPIDGPAVGMVGKDLEAACEVTASMGMTGKLCLTPDAAPAINAALAPSPADIRWAEALLKKDTQTGAANTDGSYLPRLARARTISELAASYGLHTAPVRDTRS